MQRVPRFLRDRFVATAIIALCAIGALCIRSARTEDDILLFSHNGHINGVSSSRGSVAVAFTTIPVGAARSWTALHGSQRSVDIEANGEVFPRLHQLLAFANNFPNSNGAFEFSRGEDTRVNGYVTWIVFPMWILTVPAIALLLQRGSKTWRGARRHQRGLCVACGYDLRGGHQRCPECGLEVFTHSEQSA